MARAFNRGSTQYLEIDSAPISGTPLSMAGWINTDSVTVIEYALTIHDLSETDQGFRIGVDGTEAGDPVIVLAYDGSVAYAYSTSGVSVDTRHHICGVFPSSTARHAFLDGGNKGSETSSRTPTGLDRISIGRAGDSSASHYWGGTLAEIAVWNIDLTDNEVAILATGICPLEVRPQNLVFYVPLVRDNDNDLIGGLSLTAYNSPTISDHPPIFYSIPSHIFTPSVAAGETLSINIGQDQAAYQDAGLKVWP